MLLVSYACDVQSLHQNVIVAFSTVLPVQERQRMGQCPIAEGSWCYWRYMLGVYIVIWQQIIKDEFVSLPTVNYMFMML